MDTPLVSVLIPAYNAERYLAEALDSVLAQTWPNVEAIVVDDGSKDATLDVAHRYESEAVRVISQPNAGAAAARNTAYAHCHGDFVQFFDADDVLAPDKLEHQVRRLQAEPEGTVATSAWARFPTTGRPAEAAFSTHPDYRDYEVPRDWLVQSWSGRGTMPPIAWLVPRSIVDAAGPWNPSLSLDDDGEYFTRVVLQSQRITFCPEAKGYYRSGHKSLSRRKDERAFQSQFDVIRLSTERLLEVEDSPRTRHACACYWQSFLYMAYPDVPHLMREAEERIATLGGGSREMSVSRPFRPVRDLLGWKSAARLQRAYARSGVERLVQQLKP
jgi:glycosyltransferase involved in cell wall biosynthesis